MIGAHLLEISKQHNLDLEFCRAQTYDGANVMTSNANDPPVVILMDQLMCTAEMISSSYSSHRSEN